MVRWRVGKNNGLSFEITLFRICLLCFEAYAISLTPRCFSSISCLNEYLATDRGGYVNEKSSHNNCIEVECFTEKSKLNRPGGARVLYRIE